MRLESYDRPRAYAVCDRCGFFYGDIRLQPGQKIECPECGAGAAWAFAKLDKALEYQQQVLVATGRVDKLQPS